MSVVVSVKRAAVSIYKYFYNDAVTGHSTNVNGSNREQTNTRRSMCEYVRVWGCGASARINTKLVMCKIFNLVALIPIFYIFYL